MPHTRSSLKNPSNSPLRVSVTASSSIMKWTHTLGSECFAHTDPKSPNDTSQWEPLFSADCVALDGGDCEACERLDRGHGHLNKVAWWTAKFVEEMFPGGTEDANSARQWGYLTGLWHDLGKFAPRWQEYLAKKVGSDIHSDEAIGKVDHSTAGAQFAERSIAKLGRLIAYLIAGHHPGLTNGEDGEAPQSSLKERMNKTVAEYESAAPGEVLAYRPTLPFPRFSLCSGQSLAFFLRFLFSCLTDADIKANQGESSPIKAKIYDVRQFRRDPGLDPKLQPGDKVEVPQSFS